MNSDSINILSCHACGSPQVRIITYGDVAAPQRVYVQCAQCDELVARLEPSTWYSPAAGYASLLKFSGAEADDSGRQWMQRLQRQTEAVEAEFEQIQRSLEDDPSL